MSRVVRGALVQASWTGDKESMIQKHEQHAHEAASQGAQFILFQELFYGPYFCQVQDAKYYEYTELIPDGPTTQRMQDLAKETGMVVVAPIYEEEMTGVYYNAAAVIDADGSYLGKYRKTHIPQVGGFYDPPSKTFFLMETMPKGIGGPILAHELVHALDDQLYDLDATIEALKDALDKMDQTEVRINIIHSAVGGIPSQSIQTSLPDCFRLFLQSSLLPSR